MAPIALVTAAIAARSARMSAYDPLVQTLSVLAARGGGAWLMTAGIVISASCQIVTAVGLRFLRPPARVALAVAGCCGLAVAALPVSVQAMTRAHLLAAGAGAVALAMWPVLCISAKADAPAICRARWAVSATVVFALMLVWVYYEARQGVILGLAERITAVGEMIWPLVVVISARLRSRGWD